MEKYKYLYVSVPSADHGLYHTTCVEECPDKTLAEKSVGGEKDLLKCNLEGNTNVTTCDHNCDAELMFYDYTTCNYYFKLNFYNILNFLSIIDIQI